MINGETPVGRSPSAPYTRHYASTAVMKDLFKLEQQQARQYSGNDMSSMEAIQEEKERLSR